MFRGSRFGFAALILVGVGVGVLWFMGSGAQEPFARRGAAPSDPPARPEPASRELPAQQSPLEKHAAAPSEPPAVSGFDRAKRDAIRDLIWRAFGQDHPVATTATPSTP